MPNKNKTAKQQIEKCYRCNNDVEQERINSMQPINVCNDCYKGVLDRLLHLARIKDISKEEFTRYVKPCGSSGHIGVSKHWVGKLVKVNMEEVNE